MYKKLIIILLIFLITVNISRGENICDSEIDIIIEEIFNAIDKNDISEVRELIEHKPCIINSTRDMRTPLHWACLTGKKEIAELLLSKGADVNIKDNEGKIALHMAKTKEIAEMLIKKDFSVNALDNNGKTPDRKSVV